METEREDKLIEYVLHWRIENISNFWWMIEGEEINSPIFFADALSKTKWSLRFFPMGNRFKDMISLYLYREKDCSGPDVIEVNFKLALLGKDGLSSIEGTESKYHFTKGGGGGRRFPKFEIPRKVFLEVRENFVLEETLTIQCTLKKAEETPVKSKKHLYGQTVIKISRKNFVWRICNCHTVESDERYNLKDALFNLDVLLNKDSDGWDLDVISIDDSIKYISFNISVIDSQEKKEHCGFKNYFAGDLKSVKSLPLLLFPNEFVKNKSWYWSQNASLDFDLVFSTVEYFGSKEYSSGLLSRCYVEEKKYENMEILVDDFKSLFFEGIFSDMELRTSSRTFPVHKNILSARSPVFKRMFTSDMKENHSGHVDITDIEGDIVNQMLLYIYTGNLNDLQFEIASKLYSAADKYEILSLKEICSSFLKDTLCPTAVCEVLVLADLHQDDDLKNAAQTYLFEHDEVFNSLEWKNFMDSHLKLASDVMYQKVNLGNLSVGNI